MRQTIEYAVAAGVPPAEVEDVLRLAAVGAESLHDAQRSPAGSPYRFDPPHRRCAIFTGTPLGDAMNKLFVGFAARALGSGAVRPADDAVEPIDDYRTLEDWADELSWDADELADVLAADAGLHLGTPLTATELDDRLGLALRRIKTDGGNR
jgi:hypothetical protein